MGPKNWGSQLTIKSSGCSQPQIINRYFSAGSKGEWENGAAKTKSEYEIFVDLQRNESCYKWNLWITHFKFNQMNVDSQWARINQPFSWPQYTGGSIICVYFSFGRGNSNSNRMAGISWGAVIIIYSLHSK